MSAYRTPAAERITVHEADLRQPRARGRYVYAFCHIHGGDHQRSLHINAENGFGKCFSCGAQVFCPELAPDGGASYGASANRARRVTADTLLRPRQRPATQAPAPEAWQRDELATLAALDERMRARLSDERPRAYLAARGISYEVAESAGVGYIPADAPAKVRGVDISKWRDRLLFPLASPDGRGYAGRSLWGWQPGIDENAHKALLDGTDGAPRRWEKTYPAGWFNYGDLTGVPAAVLVEGPIDALALHTADLWGAPVVALVGTAANAEWLPANVLGVVLALDGDVSGIDRAAALARALGAAGVVTVSCAPDTSDGRGKDWAERWRLASWEGVAPVFDALDTLLARLSDGAGHSGVSSSDLDASDPATLAAHYPPSPALDAPDAPDDPQAAAILADPLIRALLAQGYDLAETNTDMSLACEATGWRHEYARLRTADGRPICVECGHADGLPYSA